jgi:hypothetical protein
VQTQSNNQLNYTAGTVSDCTTSAPDFTGKPIQTKVLKVTGTTAAPVTTSILTSITYDHMSRVTAVEIKAITTVHDIILDNSKSVTSGSTLNAIAGNGIKLDIGFSVANGGVFSGTINPVALQSVDFRYNIRGQLTSINNSKLTNDSGAANTNDDSNDLFGMQLLYDQTDSNCRRYK